MDTNSLPQGTPPKTSLTPHTDNEFQRYKDLMEAASEKLCETWLYANSNSPSAAVLAELSQRNADVVHHIVMAFGVFNALLEYLQMEKKDAAKQMSLFNVDPYSDGRPYSVNGGRR